MQRYWFVCSFYGLEEGGPSTGLGTANFEVVPNPNNGQMTLHFENLTGKIEVKVYDMTGNLIDNFQTYNNLVSNKIQYNMKNYSDGVYLFVATGREGIVTKKVIVNKIR